MYHIEVKRWLVAHWFPVAGGWNVTIDIDAMERGIGSQHPQDKWAIANQCEEWLRDQGVNISAHPRYGRADVVATKKGGRSFVIEVEGDSSLQKERAMYSAIGQIVLLMGDPSSEITYGLAVPDDPEWETQLKKIPDRVRKLLGLAYCWFRLTGSEKFEHMV